MDLQLPTTGLDRYKSASQRARVVSEAWGEANLYCPSCESPRLNRLPHNTAALDYICPACDSPFQLKSQSKVIGGRINDAGYSAMKRTILQDRTPNLYVLHYDLAGWSVQTIILIPRFAFTLSAVERRKPLAATARRAGWVGCNIVLKKIPEDARIALVSDGHVQEPGEVRKAYARLRPLADLSIDARGWTLDVLNIVRSLNRTEFSLRDVYAHEEQLAKLHPKNLHVRDKIRQQLQVLRDMGLLHFLGRGHYRL
ncbi:MAG: DpnI domain-containing protein [Terriglobales bacterium]